MDVRRDEVGRKNFQYPRSARVADRIQAELASMLLREVKDPRVRNVALTKVDLSADLRIATVYFSRFGEGKGSEAEIEEGREGLERAKGFLRRMLASRLQLKRAPDLVFRVDLGMSYADHIDHLLQGLKENRESEET